MNRKIIAAIIFIITGSAIPSFSGSFSANEPKKDSIIFTFGDKTRLVIYGETRADIEKIMKYDLNALLKDVRARLDTTKGETFIREEINGSTYLMERPANTDDEKDYVRIGSRGGRPKDGGVRVNVDGDGVEVTTDGGEVNGDSAYKRIGKRFHRSKWSASPRKGFNVAVGLNTYGENIATDGYNQDDYDLKPFGSRFVSLGYTVSSTIIKGEGARLHLDLGADFSWYNMMFDGNNTVTKDDLKVYFTPVVNDAGEEIEMKKTKLVVPYVNLSLMPTISFRRSFISYLSAGVYGGYRLGSYTKLRQVGSKDVDHVRQNFYIQDLRYGLAAELGIRNFPDLFVNYDMNNLYELEKGPKVRMLSFGLRLF